MAKTPVPSDTEKPASGWQTIRRVLPYLWPEGEGWVKRRVVGALLMLVAAKIVSVSTPFLYKQAVDNLAGDAPDAAAIMGLTAVGLTVAYGLARLGTVAFQELRDAIFVRVGQRALRKLAYADLHPYPPAVLALSHHAQDRRSQPRDRAGGEGRRFPAALHAFLDHPPDPRADHGLGHLRLLFRLDLHGRRSGAR